jgi:hypothetical protein
MRQETHNKRWLTVQEVVEQYKISKRTLQLYRDRGHIGFSRIVPGGKIYFDSEEINDKLDKNYIPPFID